MKKYKTTIIALIVIIVALAAYFIVNGTLSGRTQTPSTTDPEDEETFDVINFSTDQVKKIEYNNGSEVITVALRYDDTWECTSNPELPVVQANVKTLLTVLRNAKGAVAYEEEITDEVRTLYGIDDKKIISYTLKDDKVVTLSIGMKKPGASANYVCVTGVPEQKDRIYVLTTTHLDSLVFSKHDLISTTVFDFTDTAKIRSLTIKKSGQLFVDAIADLSGENREWKCLYPIVRAADDDTIEAIITAAATFATDDHIESNPSNLAKYGLEVPYYELTIGDNKKSITLTLGNKTPDGSSYYCLVTGLNDVLTIPSESITFSDESQVNFVYKYAYMVNYADLTDIYLTYAGQSYHLKYEITDDDETLYFNGINTYISKDQDYRYDFKCIGTSLYGISIAEIEITPNHTDEVILVADYHLNDGSKVNLTCYKRDDYTFCAYVDGEYIGGYTSMRKLTGTKENYGLTGCLLNIKSLLGIKD